jgi:hypothetical protein
MLLQNVAQQSRSEAFAVHQGSVAVKDDAGNVQTELSTIACSEWGGSTGIIQKS